MVTDLYLDKTSAQGLEIIKKDTIEKVDHYIGESFLGGPLATLTGESLWDNHGDIDNYAGFAQVMGKEYLTRQVRNILLKYKLHKEGPHV